MIGLGVCTPHSVKCQWMSHWSCGRDSWTVVLEGIHPSKWATFRIKSSELCEAKSGNVWNFTICVRQETAFDDSLGNKPYTSKVLLELTVPFFSQEYHVTMGNLFSNPFLCYKLCSKQTDAMVALNQNRKGVPDEIQKENWEKGENVAVYKHKFIITKC